MKFKPVAFLAAMVFARTLAAQPFVHPGCLSTSNDFARMKAKVQAGAHPWIDSWNILSGNGGAQSNYLNHAQPVIQRGNGGGACLPADNFQFAYWDAAAAYQLSLRWQITGDYNYANTAITMLNAWANTCTNLCGDPNIALLSLQGYQFACAAENLRTYTNWNAADFTKCQSWMANVWYPLAHSWLSGHFGACATHAWANWDLCNMATVLAIGVLCDRRDVYNEALNYYQTGAGAGAANQVMSFSHPGFLGQCQESGRDQGHCTLDPILLGVFCEIAWNQGDDMYGFNANELLQISEYVSKYNVQPLDNTVPFVAYMNCEYFNWNTEAHGIHTVVASGSRGTVRPGWSLIYNHYANRRGLSAPWTGLMANEVSAEGGGGNYGPNSGGYDQLGFTTLSHALDAIAPGSVPAPRALIAQPRNNTVTLSWWGSAGATSYNVKRATAIAGPYTSIASVPVPALSYVDIGLAQGTTYYYGVSAIVNGAETTNSTPVSAAANLQLTGAVIGSVGSYNWGGAEKTCLFDGSLKNCYDALNASGDWGGLDLGRSNVITQVGYCPRAGFSGRMVGGQFQGANVPDFSSGVVTLFTITSGPPDGALTFQTVSNPNAFRYVRYIGPDNGSCNAAEIQFSGTPPVSMPPAAPLNLQAAPGNRQAVLTWSASDDATGYNVKRAIVTGGAYTTVATNIATTSFTDTGLSNSTTYFYVVAAVNAGGESGNSAEDSVAPLPGARLGSLVWWGGTNGVWNTTSPNWTTNLVIALYQDGNEVLFDDTAWTGSVSIPSAVSPTAVTFNNSTKGYTLSGSPITGSCALTLLGNSWVLLGSANTFTGGVTVDAGNLTVGNANALGTGALTLSGGMLNNSANITVPNGLALVGSGNAIQLGSAYNLTLSGIISGNGSLTFGNDGNTSSIYLAGTNAMSGGALTVANWNNYVRFASTNAGNGNADWIFNNTSTGRTSFDFAAGTIAFGSISGPGIIQGNVNGANSMNVIMVVGGNSNSTVFSGIIHDNRWGTGPIGLTKVGAGTLTLTGANDYTGQTMVNAGALITSTTSLAKGNYTVANGATFGVANSVAGSALVSNLTVAAGAVLELRGVASTTTPLIVASNVTVNGSCIVKIIPPSGGIALGGYPLIRYAEFHGAFANLQLQLPPGAGGVLVSNANQVTLYLTALPIPSEPATLTAIAGSAHVSLNWSASVYATGYNVWRSLTSGSGYSLIGSITDTNYIDTEAVNNVNYYYVVTATNGSGESGSSNEASAAVAAGLVAWLKFDEAGGTTAADSSGNGRNGTLAAGATRASGALSNAVRLDGGATSYVTLPTGLVGTLTNFSVACWVKVTSNAAWARLFDFGSGTTRYMFLSPASGPGDFRFAITTNGNGSEQLLTCPTPLSTGVWHHVAVTLSGSAGTLYLDGLAVGTNNNLTLNPAMLGSTTQNYIGKSQYADPLLSGSVDDFRLYSRALSAAEVSSLAALPPATPTGLTAAPGDSQAVLGWSSVLTASGYKVKRSASSGGPYILAGSPTQNNWINSGLADGTLYYFVVTATSVGGESANSMQVSVRPVSPLSTNLTYNVNGSQLQLSWPSDHTGWRLQGQTNAPNVGLSTNWVEIPSTSTNQVAIPLDTANGSVFFRLVYP